MTQNTDFINIASLFQYLQIGELIIFSICLLVIGIKARAVSIWLFSNVVALIGVIYSMRVIDYDGGINTPESSALLLLSVCLKILSFADRGFFREANRFATILVIFSAIFSILIVIFWYTDFRLLLVSFAAIMLLISSILYLYNNKSWKGLASVKHFYFLLGIISLGFICLLSISYPIGSQTRFIRSNNVVPYHTIIVLTLIFLFQILFIRLGSGLIN